MALGIITGRQIGRNRDGDKSRVLLQVQLVDDDMRTVELFAQAGEDVNPANGCRVVVLNLADSYKAGVAVSDDLTPEVDPGEKEIYSTDNPVTAKKARIKLTGTGDVEINQGTESAVTFAQLDTALQLLVTAINAALSTKLDGAGTAGALTLDISLAESPTVKLP